MISPGQLSAPESDANRLAIVDIGTNTIKFSVFEIAGHGPPRLLASDAETVRLGADIVQTGMISAERLLRAIAALQRFERDAAAMDATTLIGVATEAVRSASNGGDVLATIHGSTGWHLRVIDGVEEARLTFRGLQFQLERFAACVVADVGGGSTELLHVSAGALVQSISVPIGSGRFADTYFAGTATDKAMAQAREAARLVITGALSVAAAHLPLALSGGNGIFLQRLSELLTVHPRITNDSLHAVARELIVRPASEIADLLSISVERASVLPAGCSISLGAIDALESRELAAVPSGIREGVLRDWLDARGHVDSGSPGDLLAGQVE